MERPGDEDEEKWTSPVGYLAAAFWMVDRDPWWAFTESGHCPYEFPQDGDA
jgi:hypothetical protein